MSRALRVNNEVLDRNLLRALRLRHRQPACCEDTKLLANAIAAAAGASEVYNNASRWYDTMQPAVCLYDARYALQEIRNRGEEAIHEHFKHEKCPTSACDDDSHEQIQCMIRELRAHGKHFGSVMSDDFTTIFHGMLQRIHETLHAVYRPGQVDAIFMRHIKPAFIPRAKCPE